MDLIGANYGCLTVLNYYEDYICPSGRKARRVLCMCDVCGDTHIKFVNTLHDKCTCPNEPRRKSHGKSDTQLYNVWYAIKQRCYYQKNASYKNYGARGIKMCDKWKDDFQAFYDWSISNGYKKGLQIDRINVNGNYEPNNCRWVSNYTNANNKRNNINFTYNGKTMTLKEWCRYLNVSYKTCTTRYYRGHSIEECLNLIPLNDTRKGKIPKNAKLYVYNDKIYTIGKLADELGIKRSKMYYDVNKGVLPKGVTKYNGRK